MKKYISSNTFCDLAKFVVVKNNFSKLVKKPINQKRGTAIRGKFLPPYEVLFMAELQEEMFPKTEIKPYLW